MLGNAEKARAAAWHRSADAPRIQVTDIMAGRGPVPALADSIPGHTRGFVQVQTGCDHRCTFCVIPFGRGNSRSVPLAEVVAAISHLVENGAPEVVLTGVDLTSWGADLPDSPRIGTLVRAILRAVPSLPRLRLSSIDSIEADGDLMRAVAEEERLMPHLHLSLQAGDDLILKRMKRRHRFADAVRFCEEARRLRPDIVFGADLIAGFPTETDAMFARSLDLIDACGLTHLHVFPFSPREGTPAARMPQVAKALVRDRAAVLRAKGATALTGHLERQIGRTVEILAENNGVGRARDFTLARLPDGTVAGTIIVATVSGCASGHLLLESAAC